MGMQGIYGGLERRRRAAGQGQRAPLHAAIFSFCLLPVLAGCSSNSSWSSGSSQSAAVPSPTPAVAAASQGADQAPAVPGYPQVSLAELFKRNEANTPAQPRPPDAAGTPVTTSSAAADYMPYPKQSLFSLFQDLGSAQAPNVPHPPSAYTPSAQPYVPPQGQPTYSPAAPQAVPRPPSTYMPSGQPYLPPSQPAAGPPQGTAPRPVAAAPPDADDGQHVSGYPDQSIANIFRQ